MEISTRLISHFRRPTTLLVLVATCLLGCSEKDRADAEKEEKAYVQVAPPRFEPPKSRPAEADQTAGAIFPDAPPAKQMMERPRAKRIPIPDPTPDDVVLSEVDLPDVDDIVFSIPDLPKVRKEAEADLELTVDDAVFAIPEAPPLPNAFEERVTATAEAPRSNAIEKSRARGGRQAPAEKPKAKAKTKGERSSAVAWLDARASLENLQPLAKTGYWANTYLPGDPGARYLKSLLSAASEDLPHQAAKRTQPLFDPPDHAALDLVLHGDRTAAEGRARMILQVGLKATERFKGRRTAMNLGTVVFLPSGISSEGLDLLRAVWLGLVEEKDFEDRFRLIVVTDQGSAELGSDDFRHGTLTVLGDRLAKGEPLDGPPMDPQIALVHALQTTADGDDPSAPLGSSGLMLITDRSLPDLKSLERTVHRAVVSGMAVTTVGLPGSDRGQLERLALVGHGRRYLIESEEPARQVARQELAATSQAVARAVRLNIRLAPGTQLLDVIGTKRLDSVDRARVKRAEASLDLKLAQKLGIEADRGDDEDGLQIVIPAFYAGDFHTILLDVVAEPGPVAEVTARFKDLMYLDNGVARAQLQLERGPSRFGPFQQAVVLDHLSHTVHQTLEEAARQISRNQTDRAIERLQGLILLLRDLETELPSLAGHPQLAVDRAMVSRYHMKTIQQTPSVDVSLRLAGLLKTRPAPMSTNQSIRHPGR